MKVFLTGVSCVGKSTIGAELAALLGIPFFDLDTEVEAFFQTSIGLLQAQCGSMRLSHQGVPCLESPSLADRCTRLCHRPSPKWADGRRCPEIT